MAADATSIDSDEDVSLLSERVVSFCPIQRKLCVLFPFLCVFSGEFTAFSSFCFRFYS